MAAAFGTHQDERIGPGPRRGLGETQGRGFVQDAHARFAKGGQDLSRMAAGGFHEGDALLADHLYERFKALVGVLAHGDVKIDAEGLAARQRTAFLDFVSQPRGLTAGKS